MRYLFVLQNAWLSQPFTWFVKISIPPTFLDAAGGYHSKAKNWLGKFLCFRNFNYISHVYIHKLLSSKKGTPQSGFIQCFWLSLGWLESKSHVEARSLSMSRCECLSSLKFFHLRSCVPRLHQLNAVKEVGLKLNVMNFPFFFCIMISDL